MTEEARRPDPDQLLAHIRDTEQRQGRGRLKIFLGYAAGVGKTYAMLEAAHSRRVEGVDLVVGYVETHGRPETEALLADLDVLPRRELVYRGVTLSDLDVDGVLARRPRLALVDELAHTNAPGSRHPKRYQDVQDLLAAGIDVYTTLNIQHLESLNDVVKQITGVLVRETIPDSLIDEAAEIELIDLPPNELQQRLNEGKVYVPDQATHAIHKFFRTGNLTALREIAMRRAAERVDHQMRAYMQTRAIPGPWPAAERLLVSVSPSPFSERLVRTARRLADELKAEWFAVYVETPDRLILSQAARDQLAHTLQLAEELGARTTTLPGTSVDGAVLEFARSHNITKIIAGKPLHSRWSDLMRRSVVDQLIRHSGDIDVYVISKQEGGFEAAGSAQWRPTSATANYIKSVALVALATLVCEMMRSLVSPTNLVAIYLVGVIVAAVFLGRGPAILASILSVLTFDFFLVPPRLTLAVSQAEYFLTFIGLLAVGLVISHLAARVRGQVEAAQQRQAETATLYVMSRDLATARDLDDMLQAIVSNVSQTFGREVIILLPDKHSEQVLKPTLQTPHTVLNDHELAVAAWAYQHGQPAGRGTDALSMAAARYLPLRTASGIVGVMGVRPTDPDDHLTPDQRRLLEACASLAALAIERAQLAESARAAQLSEATKKLQTALLNSVSHDLRTPLVSITGVLSTLADDAAPIDEATRRSLIETATEEAERLNRLVGNLLDMTRIESDALNATREPCDVQDVIGSALERLADRLGDRQVAVQVPADLPLAPMDFVLMVQVLVNIIDNAIKYSPAGSPIDVQARLADPDIEIEVADRGAGIPVEDLERVFDKFYRIRRQDSLTGTGLGLSICKGIVEAHGGRIWARNRPGGGTAVTLAIPVHMPGH